MKKSLFSAVGKEAIERALQEGSPEEAAEYENQPLVAELRIGAYIKARGINQKQLAAMTGIREAAISQLCRGFVDRLNLDHIARIGTALKVDSIADLLQLVKYSESDAAMMKPRGYREEGD
ncbi:helix-turn-helix transcriptional regulator [Paenibacillus algorifonticola]|uniref:helix-turn-helix domain-containing protein n=1 Tax=Paenibacillus algorifonticola TaxID=684063 RepID=UPI003D288D8E